MRGVSVHFRVENRDVGTSLGLTHFAGDRHGIASGIGVSCSNAQGRSSFPSLSVGVKTGEHRRALRLAREGFGSVSGINRSPRLFKSGLSMCFGNSQSSLSFVGPLILSSNFSIKSLFQLIGLSAQSVPLQESDNDQSGSQGDDEPIGRFDAIVIVLVSEIGGTALAYIGGILKNGNPGRRKQIVGKWLFNFGLIEVVIGMLRPLVIIS